MGLFGGSDPLGGTGAGVEQVWVELRARTDKLKNDVNGALTQVEGTMKQAADLGESGLGNSFLKIGSIANVSIGMIAAQAFIKLIGTIEQVIAKVGQLAFDFIAQGVQANASIQQMTISFTAMLGSTDKAATALQYLRKEGAAFGDEIGVIQAGKSLIPYAEGDFQKFKKIVGVAEQLAAMDPLQGLKGAGYALREALSGTMISLAGRFELPRTELNKLNEEFKKTGDVDAFMDKLSELIGRFGVTKDSVEAMRDSAVGTFNQIKFQINDLARVAGAPILAALQKHLTDLNKLLGLNSTSLKDIALKVGAVIAVLIDYVVETGVAIYKMVTNIGTYFIALRETSANALGGMVADVIGFFASAVNSLIDLANKALVALKLPEIKKIDIDKEAIKSQIAGFVKSLSAGAGAMTGILGKLDFTERVRSYEDMFSELLKTNLDGWAQVNGADEDGQAENIDQFMEYIQKVRDILEKGNKDTEKEEERHAEKENDIREKAAEDGVKAAEKRDEDFAKLAQEIGDKREEIDQDTSHKLEEIEKDHAEQIRQIRESADEQLFDAVNARDAKRVYQILQNAKKETQDANRERDSRIGDVRAEREQKLEELRKEKEERYAAIQDAYDREMQQIQNALQDQLDEEQKSHDKKMREIAAGIKERLRLEARGWAEDGKLTKEGLEGIMELLIKVFGPNGDYLELMAGFNEALKIEALKAAATMGSIPKASADVSRRYTETLYPSKSAIPQDQLDRFLREYGDDVRFQGSFDDWLKSKNIIPAQFGFEGMVNKPTLFMAGEAGKPERVSISPMSTAGVSDHLTVDVTVDVTATGVTPEFEMMISEGISKRLSEAIVNRRTRS